MHPCASVCIPAWKLFQKQLEVGTPRATITGAIRYSNPALKHCRRRLTASDSLWRFKQRSSSHSFKTAAFVVQDYRRDILKRRLFKGLAAAEGQPAAAADSTDNLAHTLVTLFSTMTAAAGPTDNAEEKWQVTVNNFCLSAYMLVCVCTSMHLNVALLVLRAPFSPAAVVAILPAG